MGAPVPGRAATWRPEPPAQYEPGSRAYLIIDCTVGEQYETPGPGTLLDQIAVITYGQQERKIPVALSEQGVHLIPAAAAHALAVCLPAPPRKQGDP